MIQTICNKKKIPGRWIAKNEHQCLHLWCVEATAGNRLWRHTRGRVTGSLVERRQRFRRSFRFAFYSHSSLLKIILCVTHARRYVVSIQYGRLTIVSRRVASLVRRNKTWPCANFRNSGQDASYGGSVSYRRLEATGSGRVTPLCAVHTSFLLTLLTMSNTMGFAKKRFISKTAVLTIFPSKLALSQRSLSQSLDAEARPGSERRRPQLSRP